MKFYVLFTRKTLFCILISLFLILILFSKFYEIKGDGISGKTYNERKNFLLSLGCEIDGEATEKEIIIPLQFSDVYKNYNTLQKSSGFDLSLYKGEKCRLYSVSVKSFADFCDEDYAKANIIVYKGRIIGGDISSSKINGKMYPLKKYEKTTA